MEFGGAGCPLQLIASGLHVILNQPTALAGKALAQDDTPRGFFTPRKRTDPASMN